MLGDRDEAKWAFQAEMIAQAQIAKRLWLGWELGSEKCSLRCQRVRVSAATKELSARGGWQRGICAAQPALSASRRHCPIASAAVVWQPHPGGQQGRRQAAEHRGHAQHVALLCNQHARPARCIVVAPRGRLHGRSSRGRSCTAKRRHGRAGCPQDCRHAQRRPIALSGHSSCGLAADHHGSLLSKGISCEEAPGNRRHAPQGALCARCLHGAVPSSRFIFTPGRRLLRAWLC